MIRDSDLNDHYARKGTLYANGPQMMHPKRPEMPRPVVDSPAPEPDEQFTEEQIAAAIEAATAYDEAEGPYIGGIGGPGDLHGSYGRGLVLAILRAGAA